VVGDGQKSNVPAAKGEAAEVGNAASYSLPPGFFQTVVETANEGIWMIDCEGFTTFANDRMAAMMGVSPAGLLGRHPADFLHPEDIEGAALVIRKTLAGEPQEFEPRFIRPDGSELATIGGTAAIRDPDGTIVGAVATFSDITARRASERALDEQRVEFQTLADNIPTLCWMADASGEIYWFNQRWYDYTGLSAGMPIDAAREAIHDPEVRPAVIERWQHSLATGETFEMTFPLRGADGIFRLFLTRIVPIRDQDGTIRRWFGCNTNVDALTRAEQELARQVAELEALYESAPIGLGFFSRDYRYLRINDELAAINGVPAADHLGRTIAQVLPVNAPAVEPVIDQVFATGKAVRDLEVSGETPQQPGIERHWLTGFYPVFDDQRNVAAVGAWVVEITERKAAEQREHLLAREVDHRAKNLLAVVQSVVQLTRADDVDQLKTALVGRIQSLASAHSLLSDSRWEGVDFAQLVAQETAPFGGAQSKRVEFGGPTIILRPAAAQSLAMIIHELTTNAAKYGALSVRSGRLAIAWYITDDGQTIVVDWTEHGSPAEPDRERSGFGSRIIGTTVERQLRGRWQRDWLADGLHCRISFPAEQARSILE
jgi:PAS domain S-box-containing protein